MMVRAKATAREQPESDLAAVKILDNQPARQSSVLKMKTTNALKRPFDDATTQEDRQPIEHHISKRLIVSDSSAQEEPLKIEVHNQ